MINVHFNGEVVRCPDMKLIQSVVQERREHEGRCKYGIHEVYCEAWQKYFKESDKIETLKKFGRCTLGGCSLCPAFKKRRDLGNKQKTFEITSQTYRKIASATHYLVKESPYKTLFLTLTFPPFKREHKLTKSFYYDEIANICFSKFAENLRTTYKSSGYIAVKEYGERYKRVHIHLIGSFPFVDLRILNDAWVHSLKNICHTSRIALQRDWSAPVIIKDPDRAVRYVCKYISKSIGIKSLTRTVFISRNLLSSDYIAEEMQPDGSITQVKHKISNICRKIPEIDYNHNDILKGLKSVERKEFDYATVFKIRNPDEFTLFCKNFLYPLFECSVKETVFSYVPISDS